MSEAWEKSPQKWAERRWLETSTTVDERFLTTYPSINVFAAQMILYGASLTARDFVNLKTPEDAKAKLPWIPKKHLNMAVELNQTAWSHIASLYQAPLQDAASVPGEVFVSPEASSQNQHQHQQRQQ